LLQLYVFYIKSVPEIVPDGMPQSAAKSIPEACPKAGPKACPEYMPESLPEIVSADRKHIQKRSVARLIFFTLIQL
jgi:hypothetical protein